MLAKFRQLWSDNDLAIALVRICAKIPLVIDLGLVKDRRGSNFGDDRRVPNVGRVEFPNQSARRRLLFGRVEVNDRTILCAMIGPLPVERRRIMDGKENL